MAAGARGRCARMDGRCAAVAAGASMCAKEKRRGHEVHSKFLV